MVVILCGETRDTVTYAARIWCIRLIYDFKNMEIKNKDIHG